MGRQRNIFQRKKQDKTSEKDPSEIEISNLPDKEFKVMVKRGREWAGGDSSEDSGLSSSHCH